MQPCGDHRRISLHANRLCSRILVLDLVVDNLRTRLLQLLSSRIHAPITQDQHHLRMKDFGHRPRVIVLDRQLKRSVEPRDRALVIAGRGRDRSGCDRSQHRQHHRPLHFKL
jgi:hypothetical protein